MPAPRKRTRTCRLCKVEKDKYFDFYAPEDDVCKGCNNDWNFVKSLRRLVRTSGIVALQIRIEDYTRRARLARAVLDELTVGVVQSKTLKGELWNTNK